MKAPLDPGQHYSRIRKVLVIVMALNWLVAMVKIFYGILSRCTSMTADGFHSLADGASNIIGLVGINFACQPKDKDHPYGHKKYETLFSLGIAALLFIVSLELLEQGIRRIFTPIPPQIGPTNFAVMIITMTINILVMRYERKNGRTLKSDILVSDAKHTKADIFTSLSVIFTLFAIKMGFPILDPIATIFISLFIAREGVKIVQESSRILCDTAAIADHNKISGIIMGVEGVKTFHTMRSRGRPDDVHIDLHVQVSPEMQIDKAHKISLDIEEAIKNGFPEVTDVVVHLEPQGK